MFVKSGNSAKFRVSGSWGGNPLSISNKAVKSAARSKQTVNVITLPIKTNTVVIKMEDLNDQQGKPFKITDSSREIRKGVVATSLEDLTSKVVEKLNITGDITVVLESDGTEIDDEEYFATIEPHTSLMILRSDQKWQPPAPPCRLTMDQTDDGKGGAELAGLVGKLKHNLCHVSLLGGPELELLSDMDPESLVDITFPDKIFLEQLKEASGRFLSEKRQAQDAMDLLRLYQEKEQESGETN